MNKVVINACYGGFGLSNEAVEYLKQKYQMEVVESKWGNYLSEELERHDPRLVEVVETLGKKANGEFANLLVVSIEGNSYRIDEYDGSESVITPECQEWIIIEEVE